PPPAQEEETLWPATMSDEERYAGTEPLAEELEPPEALEELLAEIVDALGIDVEIDVEERAGILSGRIQGGDVGLFIGRRGQTIDAVQHLAQRIVFPEGPGGARIVIDADGRRAAVERCRAGTPGGDPDRRGPLRGRREEPPDHAAHARPPRGALRVAAGAFPALAPVRALPSQRAPLLPVDGQRRGARRG